MGEQLRQVGYKGYFQPDFLIDEDTNTLFLGEMNLRFSGFTPLTNNTNLAHEDIPLLLLHLAEWMDMEYDLDINALNTNWQNQKKWNTLSFLHIKNIKDTSAKPFLTGIYSINSDNSVSFVRTATSPQAIREENEVFCFSSAGVDSEIRRGDEIGGLFIRSRVTFDGKQLTDKTKIWLQSLFK